MDSAYRLAKRIVADVLYLRGPDPSGAVPFRMLTVELPVHRCAIARRLSHLVPRGVGPDDVHRVAATIAPLLVADDGVLE